MFKEFCKFFNLEEIYISKNDIESILNSTQKMATGFSVLFSNLQGNSFGDGLYRLYSLEDTEKWNNIILQAFPEFSNRISVFGYDWLGRQFALDRGRIRDGQPQILMFEPGTADVLEIPCSFMDFHEDEIPNYNDACLASRFFKDWMSINPTILTDSECVGYKIPLYLGGKDVIDNLEKSDMEVYWTISAQLMRQTKDLPEGAIVNRIEISNQ